MDGAETCIRFSFITNKLCFCGPKEAQDVFLRYLKKKDNAEEVRVAFKKFEGLYPYLNAIGKKAGKDFLDYRVVEAYWLGNDVLDLFTDEDIKEIIADLTNRGLPKSIGQELIDNLPSGCFPHHDFNVFYVGVGRITGSVDVTIQNMDNCRVSWGRVSQVLPGDTMLVMTRCLKNVDGKLLLGEEEPKTIAYRKEFLPEVKEGDFVALHWGFAPMHLTEEQVKTLRQYQERMIGVMNQR